MTSLWILLLPAAGVFAVGFLAGRIITTWAPKRGDHDAGYGDALHALGWVAGYSKPSPRRRTRRRAWRESWVRYR